MSVKVYTHNIPNDYDGKTRLREYLVGVFPMIETASSIKKALQNGLIFINNISGHTGDWVSSGDVLTFHFKIPPKNKLHKSIQIIKQEKSFIILNKPAGLLTSSNKHTSLQRYLVDFPMSTLDGALPYPYFIHRLDRATSGLIIAARTMSIRREMDRMLQSQAINKEYTLIVSGFLDLDRKIIKDDIGSKSAKTEILNITHLETKDPTSLVKVRLKTGRTHQIRKHFSNLSHPIVGDYLYNPEGLSFGRGLFLVADHIDFKHPIEKRIESIDLPLPDKFKKYI